MKHVFKLFIFAFALAIIFAACEKDDTTDPESGQESDGLVSYSVTLDATAYDRWVYFSFADTQVVEVTDFKTSYGWDIAFHRYDVRLNCGISGPGKGGSYDAGVIDFESLLEVPENGYSLNDSIGIIAESGNWVYTNVPGDTVLSTWLTFAGPPPTYTINDNIYAIKTADGKYAKIWLKDYYNDNSETGYVTMKYVYQPDGSRSFE